MPGLSTLLVFAAASLVLIVIPGPGVIYIVTRSVQQGRRAGLISMLGIEAGALVHVTAAAVGLSALLASSAVAFSVVRYAGAAYLVVLGVRALRRRATATERRPRVPASSRHLFGQGVLVNALNPKVAIFFLAFLPQFVDPAHGAAPQVALLGLLFVAVAVVSDGAYALVAGGLGDRLGRSRALDRISGAVYLSLGVAAVAMGDRGR